MSRFLFTSAAAVAVFASSLFAEVMRVEVTSQSSALNGRSFGRTGPYRQVAGKIHFAVNPKLGANRLITDIDFTPRNAGGLVEFSADFYALVPEDLSKGNGSVFYEVPNRGRKTLLNFFNFGTGSLSIHPREAAYFGDGFLLEQGFTLFWLGWQFDVPQEENLLRFYAPVARDGGRAVTGVVRSDFVPDVRVRNHRRRVEGSATRSGSLTAGAALSQQRPSRK